MSGIFKSLTYAVVSSLILIACKGDGKGEAQQDTTPDTPVVKSETPSRTEIAFTDPQAQKIFDGYQEIRKALVASDAKGAGVAAAQLADALSGDFSKIKGIASEISDADQLADQRERFSALSAAMEPLLAERLTGGIVYKQFCPMAFEGEGGYWLSDTDAIRNPYYGDQMLKCGKVVTEITK